MTFENYTDRARHAFSRAQGHARRLNHEYIGPEHVLLGLLDDPNSIATWVIHAVCPSADVKATIHAWLVPGPELLSTGKLPNTPALKRVIEKTSEAAKLLDHSFISTEHLLLGLLRVDTPAYDALQKHGLSDAKALELVVSFLAGPTHETLIPLLVRCQDVISKLLGEASASATTTNDLIFAKHGIDDAVRWYSEYRMRKLSK